MKKILFLGSVLPESINVKVKNNSEAANKFQWNIFNELKKKNCIKLFSCINYYIDKNLDINMYINDDYICLNNYKNKIYLLINVIKKLKGLIKDTDILIYYNYNYFNLITDIFLLKKIKRYLILADYTEWYEEKNIIKKIFSFIIKRKFIKFDGIIALNENTLLINNNALLINGGISKKEFLEYGDEYKSKCNEKIKILYSGYLGYVTGIDLYLKAIEKIKNQKIEFIFTGKGELEDDVKKSINKDPRIRMLGFLSREEYITAMKDADIVVNPRNMLLPQNQNNFPSKILEYISAGKIIVSTKFSGYENFIENIEFCEYTVNDMVRVIEKNILLSGKNKEKYYNANRKKALEYLWENQIEKINRFILE